MPTRIRLRSIYPVAIALLLMDGCSEDTPLDPASLAVAPTTTLTATAVAYDRIDLSWGNNRNANGWEVYRSTTGPSGTFVVLVTIPGSVVSLTDVGLQGLTQYCYKVRSFRRTGPRTTYSDFSNVACATTLTTPSPPTPTNLVVTPWCCYGISLRWTDGPLETGFRVERSSSSSGPWSVIGTPTVPEWIDQIAAEELTFCYRVIAFSQLGESAPSDVLCSAVPKPATNLVAVASGRDVTITWTDNSGVEDGYQLERMTDISLNIIALPANTTTYRDAGLPDNRYRYWVRAKRNNGGSYASNLVQVVVASTPPMAPSNLSATPATSTIIRVDWSYSSNDESGFRLQRSTDGGVTWTLAIETGVDGSSFEDLGVAPEAQRCYRVFAFNSAGESPPSNIDCTSPPTGPTEFTATGIDAETIAFAWRDNSAVEDAYHLMGQYCYYYYSYYTYCYWSDLVILGPNTTTYQYRNSGAYYYTSYAVAAVKDGGYSTWSNEVVTPAPPSGSAAPSRRP